MNEEWHRCAIVLLLQPVRFGHSPLPKLPDPSLLRSRPHLRPVPGICTFRHGFGTGLHPAENLGLEVVGASTAGKVSGSSIRFFESRYTFTDQRTGQAAKSFTNGNPWTFCEIDRIAFAALPNKLDTRQSTGRIGSARMACCGIPERALTAVF